MIWFDLINTKLLNINIPACNLKTNSKDWMQIENMTQFKANLITWFDQHGVENKSSQKVIVQMENNTNTEEDNEYLDDGDTIPDWGGQPLEDVRISQLE